MKGLASSLGGVCAIQANGATQFVGLASMAVIPLRTAHIALGATDDWEVVEAASNEDLLRTARTRHLQTRALNNIESCLLGVSPGLQHALLHEVEDLRKSIGSTDRLASLLLRAPLRDTNGMKALTRTCLSEGFASTAGLLDQVVEMQPLIQRLADKWLSIPEDLFASLPGGRSYVWRSAAANGTIFKTLLSANYAEVDQAWASLAFESANPRTRGVLARIAKAVAQSLFPQHVYAKPDARAVQQSANEEVASERRQESRESGRIAFERAMRQVDAIASAVADGNDAKARKFLNGLLKAQAGYSGGKDFAVKSLCNIAQQCADMFRTDFEYECLQTAIGIKPGDGWTLIQFADHFKRVGNFDEAIKCLEEAKAGGQERVAKSSLADVYVHMGRFDEALAIYAQIPNAQGDPVIRGARADALRRWGYLDAAAIEYQRIVEDGLSSHRVSVGLAEIAKRQGRLEDSKRLYTELLQQSELDPTSSVIYRMALANVLVRRGELVEAYNQLDEVIQMQPFNRQARVFRAAIAGLLGDPEKAVRDLPRVGQSKAYNEWVNDYVRGLLLLMLGRYADARTSLEQHVEERLLDRDADGMLRLGAAVCFLRTRAGIYRAAHLLKDLPELNDAFADSIRGALQYHVAVAMRQESEVARLGEQLRYANDRDLIELVSAIDRGDLRRAWKLEVRFLLRLAA